jgi:hypothetical protein
MFFNSSSLSIPVKETFLKGFLIVQSNDKEPYFLTFFAFFAGADEEIAVNGRGCAVIGIG